MSASVSVCEYGSVCMHTIISFECMSRCEHEYAKAYSNLFGLCAGTSNSKCLQNLKAISQSF